MKNKSTKFLTAVMAVTLFSTVTSCKKDKGGSANETEKTNAAQVVVNNEMALQPFSESFSIVLDQSGELSAELIRIGNESMRRPGAAAGATCYETTISPANVYQFPKTVTRNFGEGCKGMDGKTRKGKIISVFSALFFGQGATVTTTFENYQVDSLAVTGTMKITNAFTHVPDTSYAINIAITDAKVTSVASGFWRKINAGLTFTQVKVSPNYYSPLAPYNISGSINGENSLGLTWKSEVTKPILRQFACLWPVSGSFTLQSNWLTEKASINYGNGECDNKADLSYKGTTWSISL